MKTMLIEKIITENGIVERNKVDVAIQRLKSFEPQEGYWLAFSGGKDSVVIKALADMAEVKYEAHYSLTTVDPPELVRFIFDEHKDVIVDKPKETMWRLIERMKFPPTRRYRYCCYELKESSGIGRITITGVRWDESANRKNNRHLVDIGGKGELVHNDDNDESRRSVENCYRTKKTLVNPIIDWTTDEVWEFIKKYDVKYCKLYDDGFERLGCIGCPMNTKRVEDFERYPTYKKAYIKAFDKMIAKRKLTNMNTKWETGKECFDWWVGNSPDAEVDVMDNQLEIEDA